MSTGCSPFLTSLAALKKEPAVRDGQLYWIGADAGGQ
jgi:hypothetical protein